MVSGVELLFGGECNAAIQADATGAKPDMADASEPG